MTAQKIPPIWFGTVLSLKGCECEEVYEASTHNM